jgi:hypothetical protein
VIGLQLLPAVLSLMVLRAHFLRAGNVALIALVCVALGLLGVRRPAAARLTFILGSVAAFTELSALAFQAARMRSWYSLPPRPR